MEKTNLLVFASRFALCDACIITHHVRQTIVSGCGLQAGRTQPA